MHRRYIITLSILFGVIILLQGSLIANKYFFNDEYRFDESKYTYAELAARAELQDAYDDYQLGKIDYQTYQLRVEDARNLSQSN
ncbi:MAG TPA: hypothetical protein VK158_05840 [Acidobacteriota bacterium]|nr:hypothetical protein [Acidobacteriota bacterium]